MTKELQTILKESYRFRSNGEKAILATVIDVKGSSYRLPGAKMLISPDGKTYGSVSGGCLEADVLERAKIVLKNDAAEIITYDTRVNDNSVFSLNMGCNGIIRVLLEPIESNFGSIEFWQSCFDKRQRGVAATLIAASGESNCLIGRQKLFIQEKQSHVLTGSGFPPNLINDCLAALNQNVSRCQVYETTTETKEFFIEIVKLPVSLIIFGAGHDAIPLVQFAKNLGWNVSIVDHRPAFATSERFPEANKIILSRPEKLRENVVVDDYTVAVVMTHNYAHDHEVLRFLLGSAARYIGALGPKRRTDSLLQDLRENGDIFTLAQLEKLYGPVGLDIGADTPESIALSIVAEIQSVLNARAGGFLRERQSSIYNRSAAAL